MNQQIKEHVEQLPQESLDAVYRLKNSLEDGFIQLGQLFSHIKQTKLYQFNGYDNFRDYVQCQHNLKASLANKLIRIHRVFVEQLDQSEATLKDLGMDRLSMIVSEADKGTIQDALELICEAGSLAIPDLAEALIKRKEAKDSQETDLKWR